MKLERLQHYRLELKKAPGSQWGEILFRLASEAEGLSRVGDKRDEMGIRRELEDLKLKFTIALGALEVYAQESSFTLDEPASELAHLAVVTLEKIKKVNWLLDNRPIDVR